VGLYIHSPTCLQGVVLNSLGTGTTLPFTFIILSGVRLCPLGIAATTALLYQPGVIHDCGRIGGMKIGRGNRSTWRKPAPAPLCPP
jgi:hypothetical protein